LAKTGQRLLNESATDPYPYLDEAARKKMDMAHSNLLRKFTELAFDVSAETRWQESQRRGADDIDIGPAREMDLQPDFFGLPGNPL